MKNLDKLPHLIQQYQALCQYCDDLFMSIFSACRSHMQCAKGCASCCILETVTPLEAYMIETHLQSISARVPLFIQQTEEMCVFLHSNECAIYPVRPIICRTHGLPLLYQERGEIEVCPLNFTELDITTLDPAYLFDTERITANLIRFNLAFSMITERLDEHEERIFLKDIVQHNTGRISL